LQRGVHAEKGLAASDEDFRCGRCGIKAI